MDSKEIEAKINLYETFINETLKSDLMKVVKLQEKLTKTITNYEEIKMFINSIKDKKMINDDGSLKTQVDLGCNIYVKAKILSTNTIILNLGLQFYVELTLDEALKFIETKQELLNKQNENLLQQSSMIKANIKLMLDILRQLQGIDNQDIKRNIIDL